MNKAEINFFCEKIDIKKRRVIDNHNNSYLSFDSPSVGQMVSMISSGRARFKSELFEGESCPMLHGGVKDILLKLYEFPGEQERVALNDRKNQIMQNVRKRIDKYAERLKEDIVMKEYSDPRGILEEFEEMNFFKSHEEKELAEKFEYSYKE